MNTIISNAVEDFTHSILYMINSNKNTIIFIGIILILIVFIFKLFKKI